MTLARNAAVSARVILRSGQKRAFAQVTASPAAASRPMAVANLWRFGTSLKWPLPAVFRCSALTRRAAIRPRVIAVLGQKRVLLQPAMIPAATTFLTPLACELGTSRNRVLTVAFRRSARAR